LEQQFYRTPDGAYWTASVFGPSFWSRYLAAFEEVAIIARVRAADRPKPEWERVDQRAISVAAVPDYVGLLEFMQCFRTVRRSLVRAIQACDALIVRAPSLLGMLLLPELRHRCYGLEVVGDPLDMFARNSVSHRFRPVIRQFAAAALRQMCEEAQCVAYVTQRALQRRYPPGASAFSTQYSSVELPDSHYALEPRRYGTSPEHVLVSVGTLEQLYKGPDVVLAALEELVSAHPVSLRWAGGGKYLDAMRARAAATGVSGRAEFVGCLPPGRPIRDLLDGGDLFILASRQEGVPRAMLEAMARGLPCIGTRVGGMTELLPDECLVPPNDPGALARKRRAVLSEPEQLSRMSEQSLATARRYNSAELEPRRLAMYRELRARTGTA
jgi:glycosyltransferase involved in cell wall biosynthesis